MNLIPEVATKGSSVVIIKACYVAEYISRMDWIILIDSRYNEHFISNY